MTEFDLGQVVGADGKGIVSIELISTSGKNKTYRITFTDETYFDYTVKDGDDAISAIVTSWEQTLSDNKVPSEKLTKDTLDTKVDKVTGKGLSTEDYTTAEKTKLAGVEEEANKTVVDSNLSDSSTNPVQNNVVKGALDLKADTSSLSTVATTGDYDDLVDKPNLATVATTGDYDDLVDKPNLATVATTGDYDDLSDKPVIDTTLSNTSTNALQNKTIYNWLTVKADKSSLSTVATSGSYNDLSDKPVIPSANWTSQSLGSYGTLYVNETLRLVIFYYSRSYNYTSASDTTLETGIIPSDYRPSKSIPCGTGSPYVAGRVTSTGSLMVLPTRTGNVGTTLQAIWTY